MPKSIKSGKQFRFLEGIAHGMKPSKGKGPSSDVANKMLSDEDESRKKRFARMKRS